MPNNDGTGPKGKGSITGKGMGCCIVKLDDDKKTIDQNSNIGQTKRGGNFATGPGKNCICYSCGNKTPHTPGQPCNQNTCPSCGAKMIRG